MTDPVSPAMADEQEARIASRSAAFEARLKKRYAAEKRFRLAGLTAVLFSVGVLAFLLITMTINGIGGFSTDTRRAAMTATSRQGRFALQDCYSSVLSAE